MRRVLRSVVVLIGAGFALVVIVMALFAPSLAPQPPDDQNFDLIEAPPGAKALFGLALLFMSINLGVDLLYGYLDPRIRYSR